MNGAAAGKAPWTFWAVSGLGLVWNAYGGFDFIMTQSRNAAYIATTPPEVIQAIDAAPYWALACWGLGVWGSIAGSILLLLRSRLAVAAFAASLLGALVSFGWQFREGIAAPLLAVVILAVVAAQLGYARKQVAARILR
jgi:hypothetical protein